MRPSSIVSQLAALLAMAIGILALWLAFVSLRWPLLGDATVFHFAAEQFSLGAVPYRDFIDMQMPLIYAIHAAVIAIGGMGDLTFRLFDLGSSVVIGALAAALVWPAGRSLGMLAALTIVTTHLLFGPAAAGQRDYLMLVPALAAALCASRAIEQPTRRVPWLIAVGVASVLAALLKPTGAMLIALPFLAGRFRWQDAAGVLAGAAATGVAALAALAAVGAVGPFVTVFTTYIPLYSRLEPASIESLLLRVGKAVVRVSGLAFAGLVGLRAAQSPRARVMLGLTVFGLIHLFVQGKGYYYHEYPLVAGLACWGAWSIARIPRSAALAALAMLAAVFGARGLQAIERARTPANELMPVPASNAMEASLASYLPRGARVQMLDSDAGAFIAMARAGMRQATPYALWFFLVAGQDSWREAFIAALRSHPPDAILVTNDQWPLKPGFQTVDDWPKFAALLACCYVLAESRTVEATPQPWGGTASVSWRLYMPRRNAAVP
jgi:hypothetical protein